MQYCCHVWAGAPSCYLELLEKLQKRICRTVDPSLAASLEPLAHRRNIASLSLFYTYYFGRCLSELARLLVTLPYSRGRSTRYSERLDDFSVTIRRCYKVSTSTVSFLAQLDSGISAKRMLFFDLESTDKGCTTRAQRCSKFSI